jgi:hypothetical protein
MKPITKTDDRQVVHMESIEIVQTRKLQRKNRETLKAMVLILQIVGVGLGHFPPIPRRYSMVKELPCLLRTNSK